MPNPFDPNSYGQPSFEDLMVGALTEEAAAAKYEADQSAMASQLRRQEYLRSRQAAGIRTNDATPAPGMPGSPLESVQERADADLNARLGFTPDGTSAIGQGAVEPGQYGPKAGSYVNPYGTRIDPAKESWSHRRDEGPLGLLTDTSIHRDDNVLETGWMPEDFVDEDKNPVSHAEASARIADQLRTRRIRQLGEWSPDYLDSLPKY